MFKTVDYGAQLVNEKHKIFSKGQLFVLSCDSTLQPQGCFIIISYV